DVGNRVPIYYFAYDGAAAQFYRLADARGWVVINAGLQYDEELLERYARQNAGTVDLRRLDATDDPALFQRIEPDEHRRSRRLEEDIETPLRRLAGLTNVSVRTRRFAPPELPAVILMSPRNETEQLLRDLITRPYFFEEFEDLARELADNSPRH